MILVGKCHTPGGKYVQATKSTFDVGPYSKSLAIFGDRHWNRNALGISVMSDPEPFNEMELRYENSFGGPSYTVPAEFNPSLFHKKGAVCAARQGDNINRLAPMRQCAFLLVRAANHDVAQGKTNLAFEKYISVIQVAKSRY